MLEHFSMLNMANRNFIGEFFLLFLGLTFGLSLVGVIAGFASTASVSAFATSPNTATIYGLLPLFIAIVFLAVIGGVAYREVQSFQHRAYRQATDLEFNSKSGIWSITTQAIHSRIIPRIIAV